LPDSLEGLKGINVKNPTLGKVLLWGHHTIGYYDLKDPDVKNKMETYFNVKQIKKIDEIKR
jgi:hypothetical protein